VQNFGRKRSSVVTPERRLEDNIKADLNTLWTGDGDLRFYITTVQDG